MQFPVLLSRDSPYITSPATTYPTFRTLPAVGYLRALSLHHRCLACDMIFTGMRGLSVHGTSEPREMRFEVDLVFLGYAPQVAVQAVSRYQE